MQKTLRTDLLIVISVAMAVGLGCSSLSSVSNSVSAKKMEPIGPLAGLVNEDDNADRFHFNEKDMVLVLAAENTLRREQHPPMSDEAGKATQTAVTNEELPAMLKKFADGVTPDKRTVYLKVEGSPTYADVLQVIEIVRKTDLDRVGLVAVNENRAEYLGAAGFEVRLPAEPSDRVLVRPNPLTLVATLSLQGRVSLNNQDHGKLSSPESLERMLKDIFKERENSAVFREGTNEVEKTVFVKAPRSVPYIDVLKLIRSVKLGGSNPIGLQMDDLE